MYKQIADAVTCGHAVTVARIGPRPMDPRALGLHVERLYARATGGACWAMLPLNMRRLLHGGTEGVATGDRGIDVVGIERNRLVLVQLKWYAGRSVGSAAIMKLLCIAECAHNATRLPLKPRMLLVVRAGTRVPSTAPGMSRVEVVVVTDAEMFAEPAGPAEVQWPVVARALEEDVTAIVAPPTASVPLAPAGARYTKQAVAYRTAAEQGHMEAQYRLGRMCLCGFGAVTDRPAGHLDTFDDYNLPDDMRIAALWYRKAAAQGHTDAQFRLGLMAHYDGRREAA